MQGSGTHKAQGHARLRDTQGLGTHKAWGHTRPRDTQGPGTRKAQGHARPRDTQQGHARPGDTQTGQQVVRCMTRKPSLSVQTPTMTWQLFVPCAQSTYLQWQKQKRTLQSSCEADSCTKYQDHISDTVCSKDIILQEIPFLETVKSSQHNSIIYWSFYLPQTAA